MPRQITAKQKAFADAVLDGSKVATAYRAAYNTQLAPQPLAVEAANVLKSPTVMAYMAERRKEMEQGATMSRVYLLEKLKDIIEGGEQDGDRIRAITQASKMLGYDAPQRVEVDGMAEILRLVRNGQTTARG